SRSRRDAPCRAAARQCCERYRGCPRRQARGADSQCRFACRCLSLGIAIKVPAALPRKALRPSETNRAVASCRHIATDVPRSPRPQGRARQIPGVRRRVAAPDHSLRRRSMEPALMMKTALALLTITALGGVVMAVTRLGRGANPPSWLAMLHGLLAGSALTRSE